VETCSGVLSFYVLSNLNGTRPTVVVDGGIQPFDPPFLLASVPFFQRFKKEQKHQVSMLL
jgi:hypothetical protein